MGEQPFIGSEAVRAGRVTAYQLRSRYRAMYPDVYLPDHVTPSLRDRALGAWLWSGKRAVVAGLAAAAMQDAKWVDDDVDVELIWRNPHAPAGILTRNDRIAEDEIRWARRMPVTSPARTAFDLGRRLERGDAIARLDALMYARKFDVDEVLRLADRYRGARGIRGLRSVLPLVDGGAASPRETWLRRLFVDAGLPTPRTQIPVAQRNGWVVRWLDMGWEDYMVGAEYDGDQHRTGRRQYVKDIRSYEEVTSLGWHVVRVVKEDHPADVVARTRAALISRGWRDT